MYKEFIWRIGDGRGGVFKRVGIFSFASLHPFLSPTYFVHESLFSLIQPFSTINSASHLFNFQHSDQTIFLRQTSREDLIRPRSDHHIPVPHQTILRPDNQIRPSDQTVTTVPDQQQIRSSQQTTILDYSVSNQHSTPNLVKWYRLGALFVGWVKEGIQSSG